MNDRILELKDVGGIQLQETAQAPLTIRLTGLVMQSALGVRQIVMTQESGSLHLLVYLAPATKEMAGNLDYSFAVPSEVDAVAFGTENNVIWRRGLGSILAK